MLDEKDIIGWAWRLKDAVRENYRDWDRFAKSHGGETPESLVVAIENTLKGLIMDSKVSDRASHLLGLINECRADFPCNCRIGVDHSKLDWTRLRKGYEDALEKWLREDKKG